MRRLPRNHAQERRGDRLPEPIADRTAVRRTANRPTANRLAAFAGRWIRRALAAAERADAAGLMDRLGSCGRGVRFGGSIRISAPERAHIGNNVHIGDGAFFRAEGGLTIGDNAHISRNLVIYTINHQYEGERLPYDAAQIPRPVVIGKNVWIGMNVCIVPGTRIGEGAIIGMGAVVSGEVPRLAIVGNPPWRRIGARREAHYGKLEEAGLYGGRDGRPL